MRKFNFRLATLLRVRERALDAAASELREVEAEIAGARGYLERLRNEQIRVEEETLRKIDGGRGEENRENGDSSQRPNRSSDPITAAELRDRRNYAEFLRQQIELTRRRLSTLEQAREEKRRVWQERRREWKAVQKVLERERARWQTRELKEEQKVIDEMAQNSAGVPAGGAGNGRSRRDRGSALKAVLMVLLVVALSVALLYSIRLVGKKRIAFLESGIVFGKRAAREEPEVFRVARGVSSGTGAVEPTPTPAVSGMLITSDMIEDTLAQVEAERERLREREALLDAWEKRLTRRQEELEGLIQKYDALREQIEADLAQQQALKEWRDSEERQEREANIKRLARLYEKAKAREAAMMMLELDKVQAQEVLLAMSERQAVRILGEMSKANPERASELLESLSEDPGRLAPPTPAP